jgi:hypothetical protein
MASREHELFDVPQASDPRIDELPEVLRRLIYPFLRGKAPEPRAATGFFTDTTVEPASFGRLQLVGQQLRQYE